jgi:hypothetical protein
MAAAERAGNPILVAAGAFRLVFVSITSRHYDQAEETARTAADAFWPMADEGNPQAMYLWGGLTLQRRLAAQVNDPGTAYSHLERASQMAGRLGEGRNDYNTEFGPANVALYEISVAVDLGDAGRALHAAATVDTTGLSAERRARMLIDVARAHAQRRQIHEAVAALREAEEITVRKAECQSHTRPCPIDRQPTASDGHSEPRAQPVYLRLPWSQTWQSHPSKLVVRHPRITGWRPYPLPPGGTARHRLESRSPGSR